MLIRNHMDVAGFRLVLRDMKMQGAVGGKKVGLKLKGGKKSSGPSKLTKSKSRM